MGRHLMFMDQKTIVLNGNTLQTDLQIWHNPYQSHTYFKTYQKAKVMKHYDSGTGKDTGSSEQN